MKKLQVTLIGMMAVLFLASCGPTTFVIHKEGSKAYYLGSESKELDQMLCNSGDLRQILAETSIPDTLKEEFYRYNCTEEHSKEKVILLYTNFTPQERTQLKSAFRRHGYDINYAPT
jgi:hypothetical protein